MPRRIVAVIALLAALPLAQAQGWPTQRDFTPVIYVGFATNIPLVSPTLGVSNVKELIELARRAPGGLNYVSGQVAMLFDNVLTAKPHVDQGRLKGIAISSLKRSTVVPDIPTIDESGLTGFDSWNYATPA